MDTIVGKVAFYLFHNPQNGFRIAKIKTANKTISISGYFPFLIADIEYEFKGEYYQHPKYGVGFKVLSCKVLVDNTKESIVRYLSCGMFKGIGEKTALKIYEALGPNCLKKIVEDKDVLDSIGIKGEKKQTLFLEILQNTYMEDSVLKLYDYGISNKVAMELLAKYNLNAVAMVEDNPYFLIYEYPHIGFMGVDAIASKMDFLMDDYKRIKAGIIWCFKKYLFDEGFTYLLLEQILGSSSLLLGLARETVLPVLNGLEEVILVDNRYYLNSIYKLEQDTRNKLMELASPKTYFKESEIEEALSFIQKDEGIEYTDEQISAMKTALNSHISIITGGPGVGKTTVINGIMKAYIYLTGFTLNENQILLAAPTGRAAKRMSEATNHQSMTIHRALGYQSDDSFAYGEYNLLYQSLIIIDESSMLDLFLARQLIVSLPPKTQIVFLGDVDQLPSVGPGEILREMIDSKIINTIYLRKIHRQFDGSSIVHLAKSINSGQVDYPVPNFIECDANNVMEEVILTIDKLLLDGYSFSDIQVISPMYKNSGGIDELNAGIQTKYNKQTKEIVINNRCFKLFDRVLQMVNNPSKKVVNGDVGIVTDIINGEVLRVNFDGLNVDYRKEELNELTLAYALSVHKAQGSEYLVVILVVLYSQSIMLKRKLLYTAVSRAKEMLYIIGSPLAFQKGVMALNMKRQTSLFPEEVEEISPYDFL